MVKTERQIELFHYEPQTISLKTGVSRRVAAYCRVSTLSEEQEFSYDVQHSYYLNLIKSNPAMAFVGVYADHGISGLVTSKRPEFQRLISDCLAGKIDEVMVKSVSRFSRSMADCIRYLRLLQEKNIPVYFEKENMNSLDKNGELLLSIMSAAAQNESNNLSQNILWAQERRNADGDPMRKTAYGYKKLPKVKGQPRIWAIDPYESKRVRLAFQMAKAGEPYTKILLALNALEQDENTSVQWSQRRLYYLFCNEVYKGDILTNKKYRLNYLSKKFIQNQGESSQYYLEGHHEAIIDPDTFSTVRELIRQNALCSLSQFRFRKQAIKTGDKNDRKQAS